MSRRVRLISIGAGLAAVAAGVLGAAIPRLLRDAPQFLYQPAPLDEATLAALAADGWAVDRFEVAPEATLVGLVRAPAAADAPWLLVFGGNGPELLAGARRLAEGIRGDADWGVAVWGYRGFDASTGAPSIDALAADADALVARLQERWSVAPARLHLVGFSLGSWVAARTAAALAGRGEPPASLALLAPFTAIDVNVAAWYRHWRPPDAYRMLPVLADVASPTVVVHGADDAILPLSNAETVAAALGDRARLVVLPGEGHVSVIDARAAHEAVRASVTDAPPS